MINMPSSVALSRVVRFFVVAGLFVLTAGAAGAHTVRGHSTHNHRSHVRVGWGGGWYGPHYSYWYTPYYGYYGYGGYYPSYAPYYPYAAGRPSVAFVDTDIQPEETAVYLDGEYQGTVDDFDGFPDYLSIEPGRHTIAFKAEGYRSVTRSIRVPRGAVLAMDFSLSRGEGEEPVPKGEKSEIVVPEDGDENREEERGGEVAIDPGEETADESGTADQEEAAPAFVRLRVSPPDASVYLDGEFLGTASRVSRLHGDLRLSPGEHRIEVVRPGYGAVRRLVKIAAGERRSLDLDLQRTGEGSESD